MTFPTTDFMLRLAEQINEISQGTQMVIIILLFLVVSVITALITFRDRIKRSLKNNSKEKERKDK